MIVLLLLVIIVILLVGAKAILRGTGLYLGIGMLAVGLWGLVWVLKQVPIWVWIASGTVIAVGFLAIRIYDGQRRKKIFAEHDRRMEAIERQSLGARTKFQGKRLSKERRKELSRSVRIRPSSAHKEAPTFPPRPPVV